MTRRGLAHALLLQGVLVGAVAGSAAAQDLVSVEVTPLRVELKLGAGSTHTQAVTLRNEARKAVRVHARVDDWFLSKDGTPQFRAVGAADPFSAAAWVRVNPAEQVVEPGVTVTVRFSTNVPAGTRDGGYRCAVMFEFDPPDADPAARARDVVFKGRVATLLYATVGTPIPVVELVDLQSRTAPGRPVEVVATLKNSGFTHVRTKGTMTISGVEGGGVVRQIALPNVPVLPKSERDVSVSTQEEGAPPLPPGRYRVEVRIDVGVPAILVGETTMEIVAGRGK